jgi:hypothetical protein
MKKAIEKLGLHLAVLLHTAGADDQAYDEILESLERAKERAKEDAPEDPPEEESPQETKRTMDVTSMKLLVGGAS